MPIGPPQFATIASVAHRYARAEALDTASAQPTASWLSTNERAELSTWRNADRRRAWLRGRILAKQLISARVDGDLPFAEIEILSRTGGRPRVWCRGAEQSWSLSISHTDRGVLVAMCREPETSVGIDLTPCQPLRSSLIRLWFTSAEVDWLHRTTSPTLPPFLWAAKEAIFKACNQGESFAPRQIEVLPQGCCRYRGVELENVRLRSWTIDQQIAVLVTFSQLQTTTN